MYGSRKDLRVEWRAINWEREGWNFKIYFFCEEIMHIPKNFVYNRLDHMGYLDCVDVFECVVHPKKLWVEGIISS